MPVMRCTAERASVLVVPVVTKARTTPPSTTRSYDDALARVAVGIEVADPHRPAGTGCIGEQCHGVRGARGRAGSGVAAAAVGPVTRSQRHDGCGHELCPWGTQLGQSRRPRARRRTPYVGPADRPRLRRQTQPPVPAQAL